MKIKHGKEVFMQKSCTEIFRIATLRFCITVVGNSLKVESGSSLSGSTFVAVVRRRPRVDVAVSLEYEE